MSEHYLADYRHLLEKVPENARSAVATYAALLTGIRVYAEGVGGLTERADGAIRTVAVSQIPGFEGAAELENQLRAIGMELRALSDRASDPPWDRILGHCVPPVFVLLPLAGAEQLRAGLQAANAISLAELAELRALDE